MQIAGTALHQMVHGELQQADQVRIIDQSQRFGPIGF